jgi:transcriptional regulator with XRE-family HTH domain
LTEIQGFSVPARIEPFYKDLGVRIQQLRSAKKLSQEQLAQRLDPAMTRASIANIETGKQRVLAHTLVQIAAVLEVEIADVFPAASNQHRTEQHEVIAELAEKLPALSSERVQAFVAKLKI